MEEDGRPGFLVQFVDRHYKEVESSSPGAVVPVGRVQDKGDRAADRDRDGGVRARCGEEAWNNCT